MQTQRVRNVPLGVFLVGLAVALAVGYLIGSSGDKDDSSNFTFDPRRPITVLTSERPMAENAPIDSITVHPVSMRTPCERVEFDTPTRPGQRVLVIMFDDGRIINYVEKR